MIDFVKIITTEAGKKIRTTRPHVRGKKGGSGNWVTESDIASETFIVSSIHKEYPGHTILSEETVTGIVHPEQADHVWIIDPLDGTTNAKYGIPFFSVSIAYAQRGVVISAAIYDPSRDELFWAQKGNGAYLNGEKIHVQEAKSFQNALVNIGSPYREENFLKTYPYGERFYNAGARLVNFGSASLECAYVASGRLSLYYEVGLKPWDIAAGMLLVEEAGGIMMSSVRSIFLFDQKEIFAGNMALVAQAQKLLAGNP